ncbi:MAG TPA: hypothetical protein VIM07_01155 [Chitinophagaceae bacterium]
MQNKSTLCLESADQTTVGLVQHWYCCKWGWTLKLRLFASLNIGSGRRISMGFYLLSSSFSFLNRLWLWADSYKRPPHRQALIVACYTVALLTMTINL